MQAANKIEALRDRSQMLAKARSFFNERGLIELDCPIISASASVDAHIDLIPALDVHGNKRYLHSSPEYGMKRLLSQGIGDCFQLSHVFRQGEYGIKHNPEFMMAEWYRVGMGFKELIEETIDFTRLFVGPLPYELITYREAIRRHTGLDYVNSTNEQLYNYLRSNNIDVYDNIMEEGKDALLNLILGIMVEPHLGKGGLCALAYYPSSQAALAKTVQLNDEHAAERFEVYLNGIELANGYHELADASEQLQRLIDGNTARQRLNKDTLPIDYNFLSALEKGLPDCCGVAVGFDRLMMLRQNARTITDVIPFDWNTA